MANDILIVPGDGTIQFTGSAVEHADQITLKVRASGSVAFDGSGSGQLFAIDNSLTGSLMAVTDASGIPMLEVFSNATVEAQGFKGWRPIETRGGDFSPQLKDMGTYNRTGGNLTCSISASAQIPFQIGTEIEFIQTASAGNLYFHTGSTSVTINSKNANIKLAGQWSAATLKKIDTDEWDLIGDLT